MVVFVRSFVSLTPRDQPTRRSPPRIVHGISNQPTSRRLGISITQRLFHRRYLSTISSKTSRGSSCPGNVIADPVHRERVVHKATNYSKNLVGSYVLPFWGRWKTDGKYAKILNIDKKRKINDKLNNPHHVKSNRPFPLQVVTSETPCIYTRRLTKRVTAFQYAFTRGEIISGHLLHLRADWSTAPCTFFFYSALTFFRWIRQNGTTFRDFSLASSKTSLKLDEESMLLSLKLSRFPCGGRTIYDVTLSPLPFLYKRRVTWLDAWWKFGHVTRTSA